MNHLFFAFKMLNEKWIITSRVQNPLTVLSLFSFLFFFFATLFPPFLVCATAFQHFSSAAIGLPPLSPLLWIENVNKLSLPDTRSGINIRIIGINNFGFTNRLLITMLGEHANKLKKRFKTLVML